MEGGLIGQLGIDWKLFLSQAVNFFILLLILRIFVYKPLLAVIKERNERIKQGLEKAREADVRLREVDNIAKERIKKADQESINIIKITEQKAKQLEQSLSAKTEERQKNAINQLKISLKLQEEEARHTVLKGAADLVKKIIIKTVELKPEAVDEALIEKAISQISKE